MADFLVGDWLCNSIAGAPRKSQPLPFRRTFTNLKPQMADSPPIWALRVVWHSLQGARCKNPPAASSPEQLLASGANFSRPEHVEIQLRSLGWTHRPPQSGTQMPAQPPVTLRGSLVWWSAFSARNPGSILNPQV